MPELHELAAMAEAILAVAGEPVTLEALLAGAGEGVERERMEQALELVKQRHDQPGSGLLLERVGGGFRLATRPEHEPAVRTFLGYRSKARLSQAGLETLAIVAYRQPITLPEVNFLRGVNSAAVVRTLIERKLIVVAGRKQVVGTPLLYRTSREFLVHFGLPDLSALPTPEEVAQVAGEGASAP
ncbi:MAG TPA: SMC-Scp complex subunit ScpB [Thermoanaerobaculaceae bacterium]|nr:SMC-Scp complex subunit ScpB [Thermoanaerobaculaceae bacterium]